MINFNVFLDKNRKTVAVVFTVLYLILGLVYYFLLKPEMRIVNWIKFVAWYAVILQWILIKKKPEEIVQELYFDSRYYAEIIAVIDQQQFQKYKDKGSLVNFSKELGRFRKHSLKIYKKDQGIWTIKGRSKYLKEMEGFRIQYVDRFRIAKNIS